MSLYHLFEIPILGAIAVYCAAVLLKRFAPRSARGLGERWRGLLGSRLANWLVPPAASCDDGCSTCGKCGPAPAGNKRGVQVIAIHRSPRD